jgi:pimeloyl-ACP methyl ester carboxylesterase
MSSYSVYSRVNNIVTGEVDTLFVPGERRDAAKFGVVLLHGSSADYQFVDRTRTASRQIGPLLAMAGIPCVVGTMRGNAHSNDNKMAAITAARTYMDTTLGLTGGKVGLLGVSMGGGDALRWAANNPTLVSCLVGIMPSTNILGIYENNTGGLRAAIGTAWGVTDPTPLPAGANLAAQIPAIDTANIPNRLYYATDDTLIAPADVIAAAALTGGTATSVGTGGHTDVPVQTVLDLGAGYGDELIQFLYANGS